MPTRILPAAALASAVLVVSGLAGPGVRTAGAQVGLGSDGCDLLENNFVRSIMAGNGGRIVYISGPVVFACGDGTRIRADSVVQYTATEERQLIGGVRIDGPETGLRAGRVREFAAVGRVRAWEGVEVVDSAQGTRIVGDSLELFRETETREEEQMTVWGEGAHAVVRLEAPASGDGSDAEGAAAPEVGSGEATDTTAAAAPDTATAPTAPHAETAEASPEGADAGVPDTATAALRDTAATAGTPRPEEGTARRPAPPDTVFADRFHLEGRTAFRAGGSVRIRRETFETFSDSLEYVRSAGEVTLLGDPRIDGEAYQLTGRFVDLVLGDEGIRFIRARRDARLSGEDLVLTAPDVRVFLRDGDLDRLVAVRREETPGPGEGEDAASPPAPETGDAGEAEPGEGAEAGDAAVAPRPVARAPDFVLRADSIEVLAPGRALDRLFAAGRARGETLGRDSLNSEGTPEIARRDWIEGDSVVAFFAAEEPVEGSPAARPEAGEGARYALDRLVARGAARSLYRIPRRDTTRTEAPDTTGLQARDTAGAAAPADSVSTARTSPGRTRVALHYVTGREITIMLRNGAVEEMDVVGQTRGLYLEPGRPAPGVPEPVVGQGDAGPPPGEPRP